MADDSPSWANLLGMGAVIAAALAVGMGIGFALDSVFDSGPAFVLVGLAVGLVGAVAYVVQQFRQYLGSPAPRRETPARDSTDDHGSE